MGIIIRLLALVSLSIPSLSSFANDTAFGGSGAAPMPIKQTDVTMLDEKILITGEDIDRPDFKGKWDYNCDYTFKNTSAEELSFQMGFPFPVNDELGETTVPAGYENSKGDPLVYDFLVKMNGNPIKAVRNDITPLPNTDYKEAFIWKMTIAPHSIIKLHHDYITGITVNSVGQYYVTFVLKTGALWKDATINSARFQVVPNTPTRLCTELNPNAGYLTPKPPGVKTVGFSKDRKYVWDLRQFKPQVDLELCLVTGKNYVRYYVVKPIINFQGFNNMSYDLNKFSLQELEVLRNTIYAQYGKTFNDKNFQNYFTQQWWYEKNPAYSDKMLTEEDLQVITFIDQVEARRGQTPKGSDPTNRASN